jgi:hypothetical protein
MNNIFVQLLKQYTNIDEDFIDTFFAKFKIGEELEFQLKDENVAEYLGITLRSLRQRLTNQNSKKKVYFEKVDYVKIKADDSNAGVTYMLNYQCFERLAMSGDSEQSETVRNYFVKLREFLTDNQHLIYQAMTNKDHLKKYVGFECIYFFVAGTDTKNNDLFKVGSTKDIISRLRNYNVGRINEVDLKFLSIVKNRKMIEKCIKLKLKTKQVYKNREIYKVDVNKIKETIVDCYCKYVTKKENDTLYEELTQLANLYAYVKNKKTMAPYIVIDKR